MIIAAIGIGHDWTYFFPSVFRLDIIKTIHEFSPSEFFEFLEFLECLSFLAGDVIKKLFEEAGVGS